MVTISREVGAQTEARLRAVFRRSAISWLTGSWSFVEHNDAAERDDWIAAIRDEGQLSALCPAWGTSSEAAEERFGVFRVVLPSGADDSGFVGWLASRIKAATGSGLFVVCGQNRERGGIFDYYGVPQAAVPEVAAVLERLGADHILDISSKMCAARRRCARWAGAAIDAEVANGSCLVGPTSGPPWFTGRTRTDMLEPWEAAN
ncbi:MAG TPA: DUF6196 family protein [Pseudonocardia sp.]|uniref:DUF6196 family protein n=1 Tax=Pseudonocardia sp. TaxID=60912 RepID=UPI002D0B5675|nr:DUF6196 family protein [Pseudonocardia sp.]HTF45863.1 DUF6196 family protein [Pseudonocardia sp.]